MEDFKGMKDLLAMQQRDIRARQVDNDYYGPDGLLVCGQCDTPKEFMLDLWFPIETRNGYKNALMGKQPRYVIRPIPCKHVADEMQRAEVEAEQKREERRKRADKARCFDLKGLEGVFFKDDDKSQIWNTRVARSFVDNFHAAREKGQGMMFGGGTGSGKTFMAAMVTNELLAKGYRCKFTNLATLNQQMTANYGNDRQSILDYIASCDLVVLDDLGTERTTSTANENCYQVVDTLNRCRIPVIVTTNLSKEQLLNEPDYNNRRIYSRLVERCKGVAFKRADRRPGNNAETEWAF